MRLYLVTSLQNSIKGKADRELKTTCVCVHNVQKLMNSFGTFLTFSWKCSFDGFANNFLGFQHDKRGPVNIICRQKSVTSEILWLIFFRKIYSIKQLQNSASLELPWSCLTWDQWCFDRWVWLCSSGNLVWSSCILIIYQLWAACVLVWRGMHTPLLIKKNGLLCLYTSCSW